MPVACHLTSAEADGAREVGGGVAAAHARRALAGALYVQRNFGVNDVLVVYGIYRFGAKRTAFRNDFCLACNAERLAVQHRSFYCGYLYRVPLVPLGFWRAWSCSVCGGSPHANTRTRRGFKVVLAVIMIAFAIVLWLVPPNPGETTAFWVMRLASAVVAAGTVWWATVGHRGDPSLREALARVHPYEARTCPFCGGYLFDQPSWHCPTCQVQRV